MRQFLHILIPLLFCSSAFAASPVVPKLNPDPKNIVTIPSHLDPAKLKVVYEDGTYIKWIDENGRINVSYVPAKYLPKPFRKDEYKNTEVADGKQNVYELPDVTSKVIDKISGEELVKILEEQKYFNKVRTARQVEGWVERSNLKDYSFGEKPFAKYVGYTAKGNTQKQEYYTYDPQGKQILTIPVKFKTQVKISSPSDILKAEGEFIYNDLMNDLAVKGINPKTIKDYGKFGGVEKLGSSSFFRSHMYIGAGGVWEKQYSTIMAPDGKHILNFSGTITPDVEIINGDIYLGGTRTFRDDNRPGAAYGIVYEYVAYKNGKIIYTTETVRGGRSVCIESNGVFVLGHFSEDDNSYKSEIIEAYDAVENKVVFRYICSEYTGSLRIVSNNIVWIKFQNDSSRKYLGRKRVYDIAKKKVIEEN